MLAAGSNQINLLPDWTFFVQLVIFFCAYLILNFLVFKPLLKLYKIRKKYTVDTELAARQSEEEAARLDLEMKSRMAEEVSRLQKEREKKIMEARQKAEGITSDAKLSSKDISRQAREKAAAEKQKASEKIPEEVRGLIDEIKSKVLS